MTRPSDESCGDRRTPEETLARHLTPVGPPLSGEEMRDLIEAGLAEAEELVRYELGTRHVGYRYAGDRWGLIYRDGRSVLVPKAEEWQEPLSAMQRVEMEFAGALLVTGLLFRRALPDEDVARLRCEPPWSLSFEDAERRDRQSHTNPASGGGHHE